MTMKAARSIALTFAIAQVAFAGIASAQATLTPRAVLQSAAEHYPEILAKLQTQQASLATVIESEGAFDASIEQEWSSRLSGFYDGQQSDTRIVKPMPYFNSRIYGGYRVSDGEFPIYEDRLITNDRGEWLIGAELSLLRDSLIDERRAALTTAHIEAEKASIDVLLTRLTVQQRALQHYWRWVAAGMRLEVISSLIALMQERQGALEKRVRSGDLAEIYLTENRQYITQRQNQLVVAQRELDQSAQALGLFWRDANGAPNPPLASQLPADFPAISPYRDKKTLLEALKSHPLLRRMQQSLLAKEQQLALGENLLLPKADLLLEYSDDVGQGSLTRAPSEAVAKLRVSIPLERDLAHGRIQKAQAQMKQLQHQLRLGEEELQLQLSNVMIALGAAQERIRLAKEEIDLAERMRVAEQARLEKGASDFFLLNLREEGLASAHNHHISAWLDYKSTLSMLYALTLNQEALALQ